MGARGAACGSPPLGPCQHIWNNGAQNGGEMTGRIEHARARPTGRECTAQRGQAAASGPRRPSALDPLAGLHERCSVRRPTGDSPLPAAGHAPAARPSNPAGEADTADREEAPELVIWETTRACDLVCAPCRAELLKWRDLDELSTLEGMLLMNRVRQFGRPRFVLSGGDPLKRPDIVELVEHGARIGLPMALGASATTLATSELLTRLRDVGLERLSIGLDGATAATHDGFRRVPGSYARTLALLRAARERSMTTHVVTRITRHTLLELDSLCALLADLDVTLWSLSFLPPPGRGTAHRLPKVEPLRSTRAPERKSPGDPLEPHEFEAALHRVYELSKNAPFHVDTIGAPQYRRVLLQREREHRPRVHSRHPLAAGEETGIDAGATSSSPDGPGISGSRSEAPGSPPTWEPAGDAVRAHDPRTPVAAALNDGDGVLFVTSTGAIQPSPFLPVSAGNVRTHDIVYVYRNAPLFRELRDRVRLKGKCRLCEYRDLCGGSRARAHALTGDWLAADPACAYLPERYLREGTTGTAPSLRP